MPHQNSPFTIVFEDKAHLTFKIYFGSIKDQYIGKNKRFMLTELYKLDPFLGIQWDLQSPLNRNNQAYRASLL